MPVYNVQTPDGSTLKIEAPEGATRDQVLGFAKQHYDQQQRQDQQPDRMALMLEAERRGILPEDKAALLGEARRRGLVPGAETIYEVEMPDGSIVEVEAPQGTSQEAIRARVRQHFAQQQGTPSSSRGGSPIEVDLPDGTVVEFPAGTSQAVMESALQRHHAEQGGQATQQPTRLQQIEQALRKADALGHVENARKLARAYVEERDRSQAPRYSEDELFQKLERADAAGDREAATVIADEIRALRGESKSRADFSGVQGSASTKPAEQPGYWQQRLGELRNMGEGARYSIAETALGVGQLVGAADAEDVAAFRDRKTQAREQASAASPRGAEFFGAGGFLGDVAQTAAPLARIGTAGNAARYGAAAATGGAYGATRPVGEGESRGLRTAGYAAAGAAGQGLAHGLSAAGRRAPEAVREIYQAAKDRGINLTPAQLSDSNAFRFFQSQLGRMPFSGATSRAATERQSWNRAVARTIGEDADAVTPEVYATAKARHSRQFDELTARNSLRVDEGLMRRLSAIEQDAALAGPDVQAAVRSAIDNFTARAVTKGGRVEVPGRAYQALDTQFGQITKLGTPMSHYIGRVQGAIREAMDGSISAADRTAWRKLREEYGNRKTIRDLVAKDSGSDLSPRALMGRVTANNSGKERMASGTRGELGTLARVGQRMGEPPTSGTAERLMVFGAGAGAVANAPMTLGALLAGRATRSILDSSPLARLLMSANRGRFLRPAARVGQPLPIAGAVAAEELP